MRTAELSPALEHLFKTVIEVAKKPGSDYADPPALEEAQIFLGDTDDDKLRLITKDNEPNLRERLEEEMIDLEIKRDDEMWLAEMCGMEDVNAEIGYPEGKKK